MKITFALALNQKGFFEKKHFGDSDKFAIYEFENSKLSLLKELPNKFKSIFNEQKHNNPQKGKAIISFLKEEGVSVLVSKEFGENIKLINKHFVPVVISEENPLPVSLSIEKNIKWIKDELKNRTTNYMLFRINKGVLKTAVN